MVIAAPAAASRALPAGVAGFADVLDLLYDGAVVIDHEQRIVFANKAAERIFGYSPAELRGGSMGMLVPERVRAAHNAACRDFQRVGEPTLMGNRPVLQALNRRGEEIPVSISICNFDAGGERYSIAIVRDAAAVSSQLSEAAVRAETDLLTGLGNRLALSHRLHEELEDARHGFGVLFLDLCHFKPFNDRHGHGVGDRVLQVVAERIRAAIRRKDLATRVGGDEFIVVLPGLAHPGLLEDRARVLAESIARPFTVHDVHGDVGVSIGGLVVPPQGMKEAEIVERADAAMYEAKRRGIAFWLDAGEA